MSSPYAATATDNVIRAAAFQARTSSVLRGRGVPKQIAHGVWRLAEEIGEAFAASRRAGFVYFMHDPVAKLIKIGFTRNVAARLAAVRSGSGRDLALLGFVHGTLEDEGRWHRRFSSARVRGEWFKATGRLLAAIGDAVPAAPIGPVSCPFCGSPKVRSGGKTADGLTARECRSCGARFAS